MYKLIGDNKYIENIINYLKVYKNELGGSSSYIIDRLEGLSVTILIDELYYILNEVDVQFNYTTLLHYIVSTRRIDIDKAGNYYRISEEKTLDIEKSDKLRIYESHIVFNDFNRVEKVIKDIQNKGIKIDYSKCIDIVKNFGISYSRIIYESYLNNIFEKNADINRYNICNTILRSRSSYWEDSKSTFSKIINSVGTAYSAIPEILTSEFNLPIIYSAINTINDSTVFNKRTINSIINDNAFTDDVVEFTNNFKSFISMMEDDRVQLVSDQLKMLKRFKKLYTDLFI